MKYLIISLFIFLNTCKGQEESQPVKTPQTFKSKSPEEYPRGYFRDPLAIPIQLSANFGELRANHFHMGWDIRTQQRENLPVYAAAEGYISKVSLEKSGFGHAIYITHPNGYTTVYGHLNEYFPALEKFVVDKQYADESWEQNITFTPDQFPVTKGQLIAYSGNTGASAGPHVHFEIRDSESGNNLNPWLFNFNLPDHILPYIYRLYYYDRNYSTYESGPKPIAIKGSNGKYAATGIATVPQRVSFAISTEDAANTSPFRYGIYQAELSVDGVVKCSFTLNNISYTNTRYLNGSIDYKVKYSGGPYIQHFSKLPGNKSTIFSNDGDGLLTITDDAVHNAEIVVKDAAGNASTLSFKFKTSAAAPKIVENSNVVKMVPNVENTITKDDISVVFPATTFYDTVPFLYRAETSADSRVVSKIHYLDNFKIPVHDSFTVSILPLTNLSEDARDRVIMQLTSNTKVVAVKGVWQNNRMTAKFRDLGTVRLLVDNIPPTIGLIGWKNGSNVRNGKTLTVTARDSYGDLKSFKAYQDGKWLVFARKNDLFIHKFDERTLPGPHVLKVVVEDMAGNVTERSFTFIK